MIVTLRCFYDLPDDKEHISVVDAGGSTIAGPVSMPRRYERTGYRHGYSPADLAQALRRLADLIDAAPAA